MSPLARLCRTRGCTTIILTGTNCPTHATEAARADNQRRNARPIAAIYRDPRWRKTRAAVLARDYHTCVLCGDKATIADHYPTPALECADPYNTTTCRSLCPHCSGKADGARGKNPGVGSRSPGLGAPNPLPRLPFTEIEGDGVRPLVA